MHSRHLQAAHSAVNRHSNRPTCPRLPNSSHATGVRLQPGGRTLPDSRLRAAPWSREELEVLAHALDDVVRRVEGSFSYKAVEARFKELSPGTTRAYQGIRDQAKKYITANANEEAVLAGVLAESVEQMAEQRAPALTLAQMAAEVLSVRPNMQAGRDDVFSALGSHPIYAHLLSWEPAHNNRHDYSWKATLQKVLSVKKPFSTSRTVGANGRRIYKLDITASYGKFWKAAPHVLANLLATYLPENQATAEELAAALIKHPLFSEVLAAENGVTPDQLAPDRFVAQVEGVLASRPDLFTAAGKPKGHKGPTVYAAVLKPLPQLTKK